MTISVHFQILFTCTIRTLLSNTFSPAVEGGPTENCLKQVFKSSARVINTVGLIIWEMVAAPRVIINNYCKAGNFRDRKFLRISHTGNLHA